MNREKIPSPKTYQVAHVATWLPVARSLLDEAGHIPIWCLFGDLGMGKTTLIKALAHHLNILDAVSSPTFSFVNHYMNQMGDPFYHIDLYRLDHPAHLAHLGIAEYLDSGHYCFIEWAEKLIPYLEAPYFAVRIKPLGQGRMVEAGQVTLQKK